MAILDRFMHKPSSKPYCTAGELSMFKREREGGAASFFRTSHCGTCKQEVPKSKDFCSRDCWEKSKDK